MAFDILPGVAFMQGDTEGRRTEQEEADYSTVQESFGEADEGQQLEESFVSKEWPPFSPPLCSVIR